MRILFDQGTPAPLRHHLSHHEVSTAYERGWGRLKNGELLDVAEAGGFAMLVTTDTHLKYQQNLPARRIAVVVFGTTRWPRIQKALADVVRAIDATAGGGYTEVRIP